MIVQVMPPTLSAKLENPKWRVPRESVGKLSDESKKVASEQLGELTFDETRELVAKLRDDMSASEISGEIAASWANGTLGRENEVDPDHPAAENGGRRIPKKGARKKITWRDTCAAERSHVRLPGG